MGHEGIVYTKEDGIATLTLNRPDKMNALDAHYGSFGERVLPVLLENGIGVLAMKPMAAGGIPGSGLATGTECLHYAMNLPTSVVITGCESMERLQQALDAARTFRPMTDEQLSALLERTAAAGSGGEFEPYKTTTAFDATSRNPDWLG